MADRVAVFNEGRIVQAATPSEIYERPANRFVADFVGSSNVLSPGFAAKVGGASNWTSLRPERISLLNGKLPARHASAKGRVKAIHYQGAVKRIAVEADGQRLNASVAPGTDVSEGGEVTLHWPLAAMHVMEGER
jgi:putative spermidine/putrescine transport system ATP-binding protein